MMVRNPASMNITSARADPLNITPNDGSLDFVGNVKWYRLKSSGVIQKGEFLENSCYTIVLDLVITLFEVNQSLMFICKC